MQNGIPHDPGGDMWLTVEEAAARIGTTAGTLRQWIHTDRYGWRSRSYKLGGLRFRAADVDSWIESRRGVPAFVPARAAAKLRRRRSTTAVSAPR
jgi:excisionase family DNA binding protein